jgi:hypothetical protein
MGVAGSGGRRKTLQGRVEDDQGQPRRQRRATAKTVKRPKGLQIGILQHVLGFGVVAHHAPRDPVKAPVVGLDDQADGRLIVGARDELGFIDGGTFAGGHSTHGSLFTCSHV